MGGGLEAARGRGHIGAAMPRNPRVLIASVAVVVGFLLYIGVATVLADAVIGAHWAIQSVFYAVVGLAWVFPVRWLMYWGAGLR